jgi:hypothetical protein
MPLEMDSLEMAPLFEDEDSRDGGAACGGRGGPSEDITGMGGFPMRRMIFGIAMLSLAVVLACGGSVTAGSAAQAQQGGSTANLFVDWGSEFHDPAWQACDDLSIDTGSTVLDLMNEAAEECDPPIPFTYTGSGQSAFLTSIDGVANNQNNNGYYWVYFVNGQAPQVGFGAYTLSAGDSVAWDYKHFNSGLSQASKPE